jgi:hypothetical protein
MVTIQTVTLMHPETGAQQYVVHQPDGSMVFVPFDAGNADYQAVKQWLGAGNALS